MPVADTHPSEASLFRENVPPHLARDIITAIDDAAAGVWDEMVESYGGSFVVPLQSQLLRREILERLYGVAAVHGFIVEQWSYDGTVVDAGQRGMSFPLLRVGRIGIIIHNATSNPLPTSKFIRYGLTRADLQGSLPFHGLDSPRGFALPDDLDELYVLRFELDKEDLTRAQVVAIDVVVMDFGGIGIRAKACSDLRAYVNLEGVVDVSAVPVLRSDAQVDDRGDHDEIQPEVRLKSDRRELN